MNSLFMTAAILLACLTANVAHAKSNPEMHPCADLKAACMKAGFSLNSKTQGNRLVGDCMQKLAVGQPAKSSVTGLTAPIPSAQSAQICSGHMHHSKTPPPKS